MLLRYRCSVLLLEMVLSARFVLLLPLCDKQLTNALDLSLDLVHN